MQRRQLLQLLATTPALSLAQVAGEELVIAANQTTIESAALLIQKIPGVRVVPVANGRVASGQLVAGTVDAATGSETQAIFNTFVRPELRVVLTLAECRYRMVARKSAGVLSSADLRGKRIAFTPGTSSHYFLVDMLRSVGLQMGDITSVLLEATEMPQALVERRIDAMAMWEPQPQVALELLGDDGVVLINPRPGAYVERFGINTTATVLADPRRRAMLVNAFRSISDMSRKLSASPATYWPALSKAIGMPVDVIEKVWPQFRFPASLQERPLLTTLATMDPWAAAHAKKDVRSPEAMAIFVDASVARDAGL